MSLRGAVPEESYDIEFGKARVLQEGSHVTVVAIAFMAQRAMAAARQLANEGISVEVIDPRTVAPLDTATILTSVQKTGRLMIVEETFAHCSLGAEIAAQAANEGFDFLDAPIRRINGADAPTPYSPALEAEVIPNVERIATAIRRLIQE
jgi:2-oxoisovalerate dehydrogenase E1 component